MNSATATVTTELLRKSFASLGLPEVIISDSAATFTTEEMGEFMKENGIKHIRSPLYHPASRGGDSHSKVGGLIMLRSERAVVNSFTMRMRMRTT